MVFSSTIFLFCFLPLVLAGTLLAHRRSRNLVLLVGSLIFYAWGEHALVLLMLASITGNYLFGLALTRPGRRARAALIGAVAFNLGLLGFFKYANFFVDNLNVLLGLTGLPALHLDPVHLPIGISFFTFQALSYVIDVSRGQSPPQKNPLDLALFIALFPQLIAGPIIRYNSIAPQLHQRLMHLEGFAAGARRFILGLAKKVLIANTMAGVCDAIFAIPGGELSAGIAWLGILAYTLQIYFDFSGYSDMAIGLGCMLGFDFPENFNYPYVARSIREFWRRWHISLSTWFRDYLYIPLGGNRVGPVRVYLNLLTVFFLVGLWHGASWTFVVWGLWHGLFIVLERRGLGKLLQRLWSPLQHAYTLVLVMTGWVFFRAETFAYAFDYLKAMYGLGQGRGEAYSLASFLDNKVLLLGAIGIIFAAPVFERLRAGLRTGGARSRTLAQATPVLVLGFYGVVYLLAIMSLAGGTYNPFIYFRF